MSDEFETPQRRAIIGVPTNPELFDDSRFETRITGVDDEDALARAVEIVETFDLADGTTVYTGEAAKEEEDHTQRAYINERGIGEGIDPSATETLKTRFIAAVGGEGDSFIAVDAGAGEFAFDLLGGRGHVERAFIDLDALIPHIDAHVPADEDDDEDLGVTWAGWSEYGESGSFRPGVGSDRSLLDHALKRENNQLGFFYDSQPIGVVEGVAAQSGYVELYVPNALSPEEFVGYLRADILPSVTLEDPTE